MTFTTEQQERFNDFLNELYECQDSASEWTIQQYCGWINEWINKDDNYSGYVKQGGVRPHRPHNP